MTKWFRLLGWLEGISFLALLLIAMPLKYYAELPIGVRIMGPLHGTLFLLYCASAFWLASSYQWPLRQHLLAYAAAVFPFGTFMFEKKYIRSEVSRVVVG